MTTRIKPKCRRCGQFRDYHKDNPGCPKFILPLRKNYKKKKVRVPFDDFGNQLKVPKVYYANVGGKMKYDHHCEMRDNYEFDALLKLESITKDRASVSFEFTNIEQGGTLNMFVKDLTAMLKSATMSSGLISGRWTFVKKGRHYGIIRIGERKGGLLDESHSQTRPRCSEDSQCSDHGGCNL